jgi:rod shape-determining protein MreB
LRLLRKSVARNDEEVWAVLSAPSSGREGEPQKLARLAGIAFDRALVIPGLTLASLAVKNAQLLQSEGATILNLGAASLQAAVMDLDRPEPRTIYHLAAGGAMFDLHLLRALNSMFPELSVDLPNVRSLKERYASLGNGPSVCLVQVVHHGQRRIVDIGPTVFEAMTPMGEAVADAAVHLLGDRSDRNALVYGREIVLTGGGARMPGIDTALLSILRSRGYPTERVIVPADPHEFVVRGGWYVAKLVTAANWEVLA